MASGDAWNAGWNLGSQLAQARYAQKQGRASELWEDKRNELHANIANLQAKYPTLLGPHGEETPESLKAQYALRQAELAKDEFQNPPKTPGAMARLEQLLHLTKSPQQRSFTFETGGAQMPIATAAATAPERAATPDTSAVGRTPPAEETGGSASAATPGTLRAQAQQLNPSAQAAEPNLPAETAAGLGASSEPAMPAQSYTAKTPALTPKRLRDKLRTDQIAQRETDALLAGVPLSPGQKAEQEARAELLAKEMGADWALDWAQRHGIGGQALDELKQHLAGLPAPRENWVPITGKFANGQQATLLRSNDGRLSYLDGRPVESDLLAGFVATPAIKAPTSKFGMNVESYKALHGLPADRPLTPEQLDFVEQQIALSSPAPSTNITNTLKQDFRGFWVPIQESNRRVPGFGVILSDPLGPVPETPAAAAPAAAPPPVAGSAATPGVAQAPPAGAPKTAAEARKQAQARTSGAAPKTIGAGGVRAGQELFAAPNKEYADAKTAYDGAVLRAKTMDKNLIGVLNNDQQAMLSMVANHIGMTLSAQRGARINQAVWNEAIDTAPWIERQIASWFHQDANGDYIFDGFKTGVTLTANQARQMDNLAHEKVDVQKDELDRLTQQLSTPQLAAPPVATDRKSLVDRLNDALEGK